MQIPTAENFGNALPADVQPRQVPNTGEELIGQAAQQLGQQVVDQQLQAKATADKLDSIARLSKMSLDIGTVGEQYKEQVQRGEVSQDQASQALDQHWADYQKEALKGASPDNLDALQVAGQDLVNKAKLPLVAAQDVAYKSSAVASTDATSANLLPQFIKDPARAIALNDTSVDANQYLTADDKVKRKQVFRATGYSDALQGQMNDLSQSGDIAGLQKLITDVRDPAQYDGLTNREDHVKAIQSQITTLNNQLEQAQAKREQVAKQTTEEYSKVVLGGLPLDANTVENYRTLVRGTPSEADFNFYNKQIAPALGDFQSSPLPQQKQALEQLQINLKTKATSDPLRQQKIVDAFQQSYQQQSKLAQDSPVEYLAHLTGQPVQQIDTTNLDIPAGQNLIVQQLKDRMTSIHARQSKDGNFLGTSPFTPQELTGMQQYVSSSSQSQKLAAASVAIRAFGNTSDLRTALGLMGGDDPVFKLAGMAQAAGLKTNYGSPVAQMLLDGQSVRKEHAIDLPPDNLIADEFSKRVNGALIPGSMAYNDQLEMTKNLYAALSAKNSSPSTRSDIKEYPPSKIINDDLIKSAVNIATGGIVVIGGHNVIKPHGMDSTTFSDNIDASIQAQAKAAGVPASTLQNMPLISAPNDKQGRYLISNGWPGGFARNPKTGAYILVSPQ